MHAVLLDASWAIELLQHTLLRSFSERHALLEAAQRLAAPVHDRLAASPVEMRERTQQALPDAGCAITFVSVSARIWVTCKAVRRVQGKQ